jgi:glutamate-1-semialdehyde 2,1-aminomutase
MTLRAGQSTEFCCSNRGSSRAAGGTTRSVLHFDPFPLFVERGAGAEVRDLDGHDYLDCVGEFSAGPYGHSDPVIAAAISEALGLGIRMTAPTLREGKLADVICCLSPSIKPRKVLLFRNIS